MSIRRLPVFVFALLVMLPAGVHAQEATKDQIPAFIGVLNELFVTSFNEHDPLKVRGCFAKTGDFTLLTGDTVNGRANIGIAHEQFFHYNPKAKIEGKQTSVREISPNIYLASGTWKVTDGPKEYPSSGVWFTVVSRQTGKVQFEAMRLMGKADAN